jgi:hypothetical protein
VYSEGEEDQVEVDQLQNILFYGLRGHPYWFAYRTELDVQFLGNVVGEWATF